MLRDAKRLTSTPPMLLRASAVGAVLAAALAIAGLRGPVAQAQDESTPKLRDSAPAAAGNRDASGPLDLAYVPADAVLVGAVRPAAVYARFDGPPLRQLLEEQKLPFDIEAIEQATFVLFRHGRPADTPEPQFGGFIIRTTTAEQTKQLLELLAREPTAKRYAGRPYYVNEGNGLQYLSMPDDTTLIVAEEEANLFRLIDAGPNPPERAAWWEAWQEVRDADAAAAVDVAFVRQSMNLEFAGPNGGGLPPQLAAFAPIWENTQNAAYGISLDDGIAWDAAAYCKNPEGAQRVARTIDALATLARNMLGLASSELAQIPDEPTRKLAEGMLAMAEQLLESLTVETEGDVVRIHAEAKGEGGDPMLAALILPAIQKSREAARRTQSMNNLRQIAIAMHSYADAHKGLPPAVVLGPDGKTPHSWRVALLPYLEQEALYRQYNLNQPWDSENNRRVLEQMPDVYRHPSGPDGTTAGYFVFTGPKSLFSAEPKHKGTWFGEVTDGTSHTLLVVEANRDIPWTKPEDIPFDPEGELPELGGFHEQGFNAVLADGAARFIMDTVDPETLRLLIMMNDGTPVPEY